MRHTTSRFLLPFATALLLATLATNAHAQPVDLELGWRFLDVTGSEPMYRSQINERPGFLLRGLTFDLGDHKSAVLDQLRVDAVDIGAGPAGMFRLSGGLSGVYKLRLSYNRLEHFTALYGFANPLLAQGVVPGQHLFDRNRHTVDLDVELLPGKAITPILGYSWGRLEGPGQTTYHVGQDQFRLSQDLADTEQEIRVGAAFSFGAVAGELLQGWRTMTSDETITLAPSAGNGNTVGTVLGVDPSITKLTRTSKFDVDTPVTTAHVTAKVYEGVKVSGSYIRTAAKGTENEAEDLSGNLVGFEISRFFTGLTSTVDSFPRNVVWRAGGRVDASVADGLDLTAGYFQRHRTLDGAATINELYKGTTTFTGFDPLDLKVLLEARTALEKTEDVFDLGVVYSGFGPLVLRAAYTERSMDLSITPDVAEIVVPGGQGGDFTRSVKEIGGGATFTQNGLVVGVDYRHDSSDEMVLRTDFLDADRFKLRASYKLGDLAQVGGSYQRIDSENDLAGVLYDSSLLQWTANADVTPMKDLRIFASYGQFFADSTIPIRYPQNFTTGVSQHEEDGDVLEGGIGYKYGPVKLDLLLGRTKNDGALGYTLDRFRTRLDYDLTDTLGLAGEWARDKYTEDQLSYGDYLAHRFGFFLKVKM